MSTLSVSKKFICVPQPLSFEGVWKNLEDESLMMVVDWERLDRYHLDDILVLFQMVVGTMGPAGMTKEGAPLGKIKTSVTSEYVSVMPKHSVRLLFYTSAGGLKEGLLSAKVRK